MSDSLDTPVREDPLDGSEAPDGLAGVPAVLAEALRARGFSKLTAVQRAVLADQRSDLLDFICRGKAE